jgi:hypothetical protein
MKQLLIGLVMIFPGLVNFVTSVFVCLVVSMVIVEKVLSAFVKLVGVACSVTNVS